MWLFTTRGFYSVVQKNTDPDGLLTVRARVKADLDRLKDLLPDAKPYEQGYSDYPWRIKVSREDWTRAVVALTAEVDYHNFKDEVKVKQGAKRASVYSGVWGKLLALEPAGSWGKKWGKGGNTYTPALFEWERALALQLRGLGKTIPQINDAIRNTNDETPPGESAIRLFFENHDKQQQKQLPAPKKGGKRKPKGKGTGKPRKVAGGRKGSVQEGHVQSSLPELDAHLDAKHESAFMDLAVGDEFTENEGRWRKLSSTSAVVIDPEDTLPVGLISDFYGTDSVTEVTRLADEEKKTDLIETLTGDRGVAEAMVAAGKRGSKR